MRRIVLIAIALAMVGHVVFGEISVGCCHAPFQTADELTAVMDSESEAGVVVSRALLYAIRSFPNKTTAVLAGQIPEKWLPVIPDVQFVRLSDDAAKTHFQQCGRLLFVNSFKRATNDIVAIDIAEGNKCQWIGSSLRFNRTAEGWREIDDGVPGGFASAGSDCDCH